MCPIYRETSFYSRADGWALRQREEEGVQNAAVTLHNGLRGGRCSLALVPTCWERSRGRGNCWAGVIAELGFP